MKVCGICSRTYGDDARICVHDGHRLNTVCRNATTGAAPLVDWDGPIAGDIVGKYRLESLIAEGGMGRIFKATHLSLGRPVAIKFILPEHATRADLVQRFFNEARAVNAIHHPHIIDIFDFVEEPDAEGQTQVYMVMEYLDGEDARTRMRRSGPLDPEVVVSIAVQVAETLGAAHDAGILHRDLKPDNVFLCRTGKRDDFVKLLDFGAAKAFGSRHAHNLTRPGVAIGTPEYMSPEQIANQPLDHRVDAYGLGCVCYELLTATLPFSAPNVAGVLALQSTEPPEPINQRRRQPPLVPDELAAVVMRCMEKRREDRYPDLWSVADAFRDCLHQMPRRPVLVVGKANVSDDGPTISTNVSDDGPTVESLPPLLPEEEIPVAMAPPVTAKAAAQTEAAQPALRPADSRPADGQPAVEAARSLPAKATVDGDTDLDLLPVKVPKGSQLRSLLLAALALMVAVAVALAVALWG